MYVLRHSFYDKIWQPFGSPCICRGCAVTYVTTLPIAKSLWHRTNACASPRGDSNIPQGRNLRSNRIKSNTWNALKNLPLKKIIKTMRFGMKATLVFVVFSGATGWNEAFGVVSSFIAAPDLWSKLRQRIARLLQLPQMLRHVHLCAAFSCQVFMVGCFQITRRLFFFMFLCFLFKHQRGKTICKLEIKTIIQICHRILGWEALPTKVFLIHFRVG